MYRRAQTSLTISPLVAEIKKSNYPSKSGAVMRLLRPARHWDALGRN
jgi:hypothetical protein